MASTTASSEPWSQRPQAGLDFSGLAEEQPANNQATAAGLSDFFSQQTPNGYEGLRPSQALLDKSVVEP
jgi:hypothetical protein